MKVTRKVFWIFFLSLKKEREPKNDVPAPKVKGKRELKNLECSINFEAKGRGSNRVNGRVV